MSEIDTANQLEDGASRTEFGFTRTECACTDCVAHCRHIPGYLISADVERIGQHLGYKNIVEFALKYLLASPGATVMHAGRIFRIPTLVPRRKADGTCVFLENNRCRIHKLSPYGCSFFDAHQSHTEATERSSRGLQEIILQWAARPYSRTYTILWRMLYLSKLRAVPAHIARARMAHLSVTDENRERAAGTK
jgi:Fe-S-cluster containining protein